MLDCGLGRQERSSEVNVHDFAEFLQREFLDRMHDLDARIGYERIKPPKRVGNGIGCFDNLRFVGHIHRKGSRIASARGLDRLDRFGSAFQIEIAHPDPRALGRKSAGNRASDARSRSGYQRHMTVQLHRQIPCLINPSPRHRRWPRPIENYIRRATRSRPLLRR